MFGDTGNVMVVSAGGSPGPNESAGMTKLVDFSFVRVYEGVAVAVAGVGILARPGGAARRPPRVPRADIPSLPAPSWETSRYHRPPEHARRPSIGLLWRTYRIVIGRRALRYRAGSVGWAAGATASGRGRGRWRSSRPR